MTALWAYLRGKKGPSGFGSNSTSDQVATHFAAQAKDKVIVVTGCNCGIGKETVKSLAAQGAKVIMACRSMDKCSLAIQDIRASVPEADVVPMVCDLGSFESIRSFVTAYQALQLPALDILINNAGVMACPLDFTQDGHEMQFGTNHLGHFLLTELLIQDLRKAKNGRVVLVSSTAHSMSYAEGIRFDDLKGAEKYHMWKAYGQSKLSNLLYAKSLDERCQGDDGLKHIHAVSLHPGVIKTELGRHLPAFVRGLISFAKPFLKTIPQGAATTVYCALAPEVMAKGGQYFADCNEDTPMVAQATDPELWKRLQQVSEELTGMSM